LSESSQIGKRQISGRSLSSTGVTQIHHNPEKENFALETIDLQQHPVASSLTSKDI